MGKRFNKDSCIAAAVTFIVALALLLFLYFGGMRFDRALLAASSQPEVMDPEEELFIEPEILNDLGEENATQNDEPAPSAAGEPEKGEEDNSKQSVPGKNPRPAPQAEKPVVQKKESPVKATEPPANSEEKKKATSKLANKFAPKNGTETGKTGGSGAGGAGIGITGSVTGRTFKGCPKPDVELQNKVVVEVKVVIDSEGRVTSATARSKSGKASAAILRACEQSARKARWSEDKDTPSARGSLTFTITPR